MHNQKGIFQLSPLIIIAAVGIILFLLASGLFDFKDNIFSQLFPKPISEAARRIIPPWWRRPPKPPPTPTPAPTPTPTPTPAPSVRGPAAIGMAVDSSNISWWNERAKDTDLVLGNTSILNSASSAKGTRVLFIDPNNPTKSMDTAKTNGWTVTSNIEDNDIDYVISEQKEQYQMAKDRGLTFTFGPTGRQLEDKYAYSDYALVRNADIIAYQTQRYQDSLSVDEYASTVKDLIGKIRPYIGQQKVRVQVSVNPPPNRCTSAESVIKYIDSIADGSANSPDAIVIFVSPQYDSECSEKRIDVAKKVVEHYRP